MGAFTTERTFTIQLQELEPVAQEVAEHFRTEGYTVSSRQLGDDFWGISISRGDTFKKVVAMDSALNIEIKSVAGGTRAKAGIGAFDRFEGAHAAGIAIAWFVTPLVGIPAIWGLVQQSKLDEQALQIIEQSLHKHAGGAPAPETEVVAVGENSPAGAATQSASATTAMEGSPGKYCAACGATLPEGARFCPACGNKIAAIA
jgi:hypothetical protein